jgi:hypothetical protein
VGQGRDILEVKIVNGWPRLKASYIMRADPRAKAAYDAIRHRGASAEEAADQIEYVAEQLEQTSLFCFKPKSGLVFHGLSCCRNRFL